MKKLNLLSYNKRTIVQNTWSRDKHDSDTDDEYFANLMKEDTTKPDNLLPFNETNGTNGINKLDKSDESTSDEHSTTESDTDSEERPQLFPYIKK
jgi:hypothetical protein